jgi:hypothetical protein
LSLLLSLVAVSRRPALQPVPPMRQGPPLSRSRRNVRTHPWPKATPSASFLTLASTTIPEPLRCGSRTAESRPVLLGQPRLAPVEPQHPHATRGRREGQSAGEGRDGQAGRQLRVRPVVACESRPPMRSMSPVATTEQPGDVSVEQEARELFGYLTQAMEKLFARSRAAQRRAKWLEETISASRRRSRE